ncbi:hypothetical protein D3C79_766690 [compost metagenome]
MIGGVGLIVFRQRLPVRIEMFDHAVVAGSRMALNDALDDAQGALQPERIAGHIRQGEKGLGGVHVAVGTTVGFRLLPVAGKGLAQRPLFLAPEAFLDDPDRFLQHTLRTAGTGYHCRACGQRDEGMQVGRLADATLPLRAIEPTAVRGVMQRPAQGLYAMLHQCQAAWYTLEVRQGEAVGHARSCQGFGKGRRRQLATGVEIGEAFRHLRGHRERQQPPPFVGEPGGMFQRIDRVHAATSSMPEVCRV